MGVGHITTTATTSPGHPYRNIPSQPNHNKRTPQSPPPISAILTVGPIPRAAARPAAMPSPPLPVTPSFPHVSSVWLKHPQDARTPAHAGSEKSTSLTLLWPSFPGTHTERGAEANGGPWDEPMDHLDERPRLDTGDRGAPAAELSCWCFGGGGVKRMQAAGGLRVRKSDKLRTKQRLLETRTFSLVRYYTLAKYRGPPKEEKASKHQTVHHNSLQGYTR